MIHCKLPLMTDVMNQSCCFDFNKELVTCILDCKMVDND